VTDINDVTKTRRYWCVLPDGNEVHVTASRSTDRSKQDYYLWSLAEFKTMVEKLPKDFSVSVTLIMCCDSEETGGVELFEFLERQAKEKGLDQSSWSFLDSARTTAEEVKAMQFEEWIKDDRNLMKVMREAERQGLFESSIGDDGKLYYQRTARQVSDGEIEQFLTQRRDLDS
jgi:hypothetical protein